MAKLTPGELLRAAIGFALLAVVGPPVVVIGGLAAVGAYDAFVGAPAPVAPAVSRPPPAPTPAGDRFADHSKPLFADEGAAMCVTKADVVAFLDLDNAGKTFTCKTAPGGEPVTEVAKDMTIGVGVYAVRDAHGRQWWVTAGGLRN